MKTHDEIKVENISELQVIDVFSASQPTFTEEPFWVGIALFSVIVNIDLVNLS